MMSVKPNALVMTELAPSSLRNRVLSTEEEPPTATSAPVAGEVEPAVAAGSSRPFVIEVPEFTVARPPAPEQVRLEPESATPAETAAAPEITAAPIAEAATSERPARLGEMRAAPMHPETPPPRAASSCADGAAARFLSQCRFARLLWPRVRAPQGAS